MKFKHKRILMKTFIESQFEVMWVSEFQTKANCYEDIFLVSLWSFLRLRVSNQSKFPRRSFLSLSLKLFKFTSFKQKLILMKTFVRCQFEVIQGYEFQTNANSYEDICWVSVWSYLSLWVSNKSEFWWRHLLWLSLKLFNLMSFTQNRILMMTFAKSQFGVMSAYQFQTKASSYEDIWWVSGPSYVSLWVSNKSRLLWRHLLSLSLELFKLYEFETK